MLQKGVCSLLASFSLLCAYQLCWEMPPDRRTCHGLSIYHLELNPRLGIGNDFTLRYEHFQSQFLLMPVVVKHRTFRGHELLLPTVQEESLLGFGGFYSLHSHKLLQSDSWASPALSPEWPLSGADTTEQTLHPRALSQSHIHPVPPTRPGHSALWQ